MDHQPIKPNEEQSAAPADSIRSFDDAPREPEEPRKQSGPGIASFVLAIVCIFGFILSMSMILNSSLQDYIGPNGTVDQAELQAKLMNDGALIGGVFLFLGALAAGFVGLILGIIGLAIRNRRKVFAIVGTVLNGLVIVGLGALIVLGLALGGGA